MERINHLTAVSWIINNECNLKCKHCYPDSAEQYKKLPLRKKEEIKKMAESISTVSPDIIIISGGEPFLCGNLFEYIEEAKKIAKKELCMCSHGLFIDEKNAKKLKDAGMNCVSLSVCNPIKEKEDEFRGGVNIIERVSNAIKELKKVGIFVTLDMTLTKYNKDYIKEFVDLAQKLEVDVIMFKRFRLIGRGNNNEWLKLPPNENMKALREIFDIAVSNPKIQIKVDDPLYSLLVCSAEKEMLPEYMSKDISNQTSIIPVLIGVQEQVVNKKNELTRYWGCKAGVEWVGIDHEGNVSPCPLLGYAGLKIGNVLDNTLINIINNSKEIEMLWEHKSNCENVNICGGCRAETYAMTSNMLEKDPMCIYCKEKCYKI